MSCPRIISSISLKHGRVWQHLFLFFTSFSSGTGVCAELRPVVPVFALHEEWRSVIAVFHFKCSSQRKCKRADIRRAFTLSSQLKQPGHFPPHRMIGNCSALQSPDFFSANQGISTVDNTGHFISKPGFNKCITSGLLYQLNT